MRIKKRRMKIFFIFGPHPICGYTTIFHRAMVVWRKMALYPHVWPRTSPWAYNSP